jgi:asparagine synthetase B (glutamine-hydrolysing)
MCGIFGVIAPRAAAQKDVTRLVQTLFRLSESRGKEASGLAGLAGSSFRVLKSPVAASRLLRTRTFASYAREVLDAGSIAVVGHSRLVTNGTQSQHSNNQPVAADDIVGVHNGIVVNVEDLWRNHSDLERESEVDTEILFRLIRKHATGQSFVTGIQRAYAEVYGVANIAIFASELAQLVLATNNGSVYYASQPGLFAFASEEFILKQALGRTGFTTASENTTQLVAGSGLLIDLEDASTQSFSLTEPSTARERNGAHRTIAEQELEPALKLAGATAPPIGVDRPPAWFWDTYERNREAVAQIRRCVLCVQPETLPFVAFDENGICLDCRNARELPYHGHDALQAVLEPHRRTDGKPEVLVPLSGGRDSCYALHYIKTVLKMNPIAYTYDWGMVTDLARRNASRLCSKLGVEHIIVSADITRKRDYIRKNVEAWMKRPDLGIIPLFMAGDKQFFFYSEKLQKQTGVKYQIWGNNRLERTDFKTGFCGFDRAGYRDHSLFRMNAWHSVRLAAYYLRAYLRTPAYFNASVPDTLFSYFIYYVKKLDYLDFYDYIPWDETTVVRTLIDEYDWETSPDTSSTWRIGDGTASFYNYIYWTVAGFSESDTFRSGQVRAGSLTREQALDIVAEENRPRFASLSWYCRTIGIDLERTLRVINDIPKLYSLDVTSVETSIEHDRMAANARR